MKNDNWIKSPWTISIGTAVFSIILTMIYDYSKEIPVLSTVVSLFNWIGNLIWSVLDFDIKVWWIILAFGLIILALLIYSKFEKEDSSVPDFHSYREDKFKYWRWTWNWEYNNSRSVWIVSNLTAHCPKCDTSMINNSSMILGLNFTCPRCDFFANDSQCDNPFNIEHIILDNLDRKNSEK